MRRLGLASCISAAVSILICSSPGSSQEPVSASIILDHLEENLTLGETVEIHAISQLNFESNMDLVMWGGSIDITIFAEGDQTAVNVERRRYDKADNLILFPTISGGSKEAQRHLLIQTGERRLSHEFHDPPHLIPGRITNVSGANGSIFAGTEGEEIARGYLAQDIPNMIDILRESPDISVAPSVEQINGANTYKVSAAHPEFGRYTLWLDPAIGYLPRRIEVNKGKAHRYYLGPVGDRNRADDGEPISLEEVDFEVDNFVYEEIGGRNVIIFFEARKMERYAGDKFVEFNWIYERTKIDFDPPMPEVSPFSLDNFPNGARFHDGKLKLLFELKDGYLHAAGLDKTIREITKLITPEETKNTSQAEEPVGITTAVTENFRDDKQGSTDNRSTFLLVIGLGLVAVIMVGTLRWRMKS